MWTKSWWRCQICNKNYSISFTFPMLFFVENRHFTKFHHSPLIRAYHNSPQLTTISPQPATTSHKFQKFKLWHHNLPQPTLPISTPMAPATTCHNSPQPTYLAFAHAISCHNSPQPTTTHHSPSLQKLTTTHHKPTQILEVMI